MPSESARVKLVIDTDPGIDDAMAILYAARTPELDLLGLTTIFGNVTVDIATRNALRLVEMAGLDIPVARGAAGPLVRPQDPPTAHVHGAEGFGSVPPTEPAGKVVAEDAADFLCRMAREHKGELVVCAVGPITNLAEAARRDPQFAGNLAGIVVMGGAVYAPGNITPFAEANTFKDPHALSEVIGSGARVTLVGLDVTLKVLCTEPDFAALRDSDTEFGPFLYDAAAFYLDFYSSIGLSGCGLHDPAAIIACHRPDLFEIRPVPLKVTEDGEQIGRTAPAASGDAPVVDVCVDADMDAVKARFMAAFGVCAEPA